MQPIEATAFEFEGLTDAERDVLRRVHEIDDDVVYLRSHTGGLTDAERKDISENLKSRRIAHRDVPCGHTERQRLLTDFPNVDYMLIVRSVDRVVTIGTEPTWHQREKKSDLVPVSVVSPLRLAD
jgi:hypothetical protein